MIFGIKYFDKKDDQYLLHALQKSYDIFIDCTGRNYCGITID